jgi:hypothetical protein
MFCVIIGPQPAHLSHFGTAHPSSMRTLIDRRESKGLSPRPTLRCPARTFKPFNLLTFKGAICHFTPPATPIPSIASAHFPSPRGRGYTLSAQPPRPTSSNSVLPRLRFLPICHPSPARRSFACCKRRQERSRGICFSPSAFISSSSFAVGCELSTACTERSRRVSSLPSPFFSHYSELFTTSRKVISRLFKQIQTLTAKHPGCGGRSRHSSKTAECGTVRREKHRSEDRPLHSSEGRLLTESGTRIARVSSDCGCRLLTVDCQLALSLRGRWRGAWPAGSWGRRLGVRRLWFCSSGSRAGWFRGELFRCG